MDPFKHQRRPGDETISPEYGEDDQPEKNAAVKYQEPFMGIKARRMASFHRDYKGDYINVPAYPYLLKLLEKQGDKNVLFADTVIKLTGTGKMKRRVLLITEFAIFIIDPESDALKRRIVLAAVECLCLSKLNDNFIAIIIPTEYDLLLATTRKNEIVTVLADVTRTASDYELKVVFSNRFEYHSTAETRKEVAFEEIEGGVIKTKISTM